MTSPFCCDVPVMTRALGLPTACFMALLWTPPSIVAAQTATCLATTAAGSVQGMRRGDTCTYLGVPYAAPPLGDLRWRPPQRHAPWAPGILTANVTRQCPQVNVNTGALAGEEDCLLLNIWAPAVPAASAAPVMVWLHTGGFQAANANFPASDGQRFAQDRGAIVVAPNYRIGPLGFLAHNALAAEDPNYPSSGNYGFADQRAALQWVRENIAAFGGDPTNVTLAGTSAGAISTSLHLVSPSSRGLFHRAVLQSGQATARWRTSPEAEAQAEAFATALGCTNRANLIACLRSASHDRVLQALSIGQAQFLEEQGRVQWGPVVDGVEIPDQPRELFRRGSFSRIPLIIGAMSDEGWTYVDRSFPAGLEALQYERAVRGEFGMDADAILRLYPVTGFPTPKDALSRLAGDAEVVCEARRVARVMHHDGAPVYFYSFEYPLEGLAGGRVFHGLESNFLFGNNFGVNPNLGITSPRALTAADLVIYDAMSTYWRQFMETGDPNPRGAPVQWPPYRPGPFEQPVDASRSDRHFVFGERLGVANYLRDAPCNFWESFYFRSAFGTVPAAAR